MKDVVVIGVAGGTGSGKSTLVKRLQEAFCNEDVVTICHDFYYKAHPELTYEERTLRLRVEQGANVQRAKLLLRAELDVVLRQSDCKGTIVAIDVDPQ